MANKFQYTPKPGWFDLSKLKLPKKKLRAYVELQARAQISQEPHMIQYHQQHNPAQLARLNEMCAKMNLDLILHYDALEKG